MADSSPGDIGPTKTLPIPGEKGVQYQSADLLIEISPPGSRDGILYEGTSPLDGKGIDVFYWDAAYDTVTPVTGNAVSTLRTGLKAVYSVDSGTATFKLTSSTDPTLPPVIVAIDVPHFADIATLAGSNGPPVAIEQNPDAPIPSGVALVFQDPDVEFSNISWQTGNFIPVPLVTPVQPPTTPTEINPPIKVTPATAAGYKFTPIIFTGETQLTQALGINNGETIDGFHGMATNVGFTTTNLGMTFTPFSAPNATLTQLVGINNSGLEVGFTTINGVTHGFVLATPPGMFSITDEPNTAFNQLLAANDMGQFAGYSSLDPTGQTLQLAYVREFNGTYTTLDNASHSLKLPANVNSQATGIDNAGDVVGFFMPTATTSNGYLIKHGGIAQILQFPGSTFTQALGINNKGQVSGFYQDAAGNMHGFVWSNDNWTTVDVPGATNSVVNSINDASHAVGFSTTGTVTQGFEVNLPYAQYLDTSKNDAWQQTLSVYTGPVPRIENEFITPTLDNINLTATTPNVFLHSGPGQDALHALSGSNILDGGTGSNFLTNASGLDTDFVDARGATKDIWSTLNNFQSGDSATLWGITAADFRVPWGDNQGAVGFTGLTAHIPVNGITASLTLPGYTTADLNNGRLQVSFGTDAASGSPFMFVHAT